MQSYESFGVTGPEKADRLKVGESSPVPLGEGNDPVLLDAPGLRAAAALARAGAPGLRGRLLTEGSNLNRRPWSAFAEDAASSGPSQGGFAFSAIQTLGATSLALGNLYVSAEYVRTTVMSTSSLAVATFAPWPGPVLARVTEGDGDADLPRPLPRGKLLLNSGDDKPLVAAGSSQLCRNGRPLCHGFT